MACSSDPDASPPDAAGGAGQGGGGSALGGNAGNGGSGVHEGGLSEGSAGADGNAVEGGSAGAGGGAVEGGAIEGGAFDAEASTPIPDHCGGGFGASQTGCPCATEGQYYCYQAGDGLDCMGGVWTHLIDGPCWPTDASNCTDQVADCKCPLLRQHICVNGQGLECFFAGRWRSDPTAACGDSSTPPD